MRGQATHGTIYCQSPFPFGEASCWVGKKRIRAAAGVTGDAGKQGFQFQIKSEENPGEGVEPPRLLCTASCKGRPPGKEVLFGFLWGAWVFA